MKLALAPGAHALAITGAALFLAGLLQGAAVDMFANPRMALSAHLDAVQSGTAVMVAALLWPAGLGPVLEPVARWGVAAGMVGLWLGITLAAITGASDALPMAGEGYVAGAVAELATTSLIVASSGALVIGWALFVYGLARAL